MSPRAGIMSYNLRTWTAQLKKRSRYTLALKEGDLDEL